GEPHLAHAAVAERALDAKVGEPGAGAERGLADRRPECRATRCGRGGVGRWPRHRRVELDRHATIVAGWWRREACAAGGSLVPRPRGHHDRALQPTRAHGDLVGWRALRAVARRRAGGV